MTVDLLKPTNIFFYLNAQEQYQKSGVIGTCVLQYKNGKESSFQLSLAYGVEETQEPGFMRHQYKVFIRGVPLEIDQFSGPAWERLEKMVLETIRRIKTTFAEGPDRYGWNKAYRWNAKTDQVTAEPARRKKLDAAAAKDKDKEASA